MKFITYNTKKFVCYGKYYEGEKGDFFADGSPDIFEIHKIELIDEDTTIDFTEFLENDMEEIEQLILNKYYE